ncbi:MAG: nicotinate mononucleotide-dependent phosphoribosyltransferase CobT [Cyanobacteria bacterium P01_D01_bin.1]
MIRLCAEATAGEGNRWLNQHRGNRPLFTCILSFTETALIPDISAAGETPQKRRLTAAADGEYLLKGTSLPYLPAGISPALITRAILLKQAIDCQLISTGLPTPLSVPHLSIAQVTAKSIQSGRAMSTAEVNLLWQAGKELGQQLTKRCVGSYLIIGECVVGGTTTAQAILAGLGYSVTNRVGSSLRLGNHAQKQRLVSQGLARWKGQQKQSGSALGLVSAVGDPMQIVAAAMTLTASQVCGVLLAGGSQMLAVYALSQALAKEQGMKWRIDRIAVGTTRWVIEDAIADTTSIAQQIGATYLASEIDFSQSPYVKLRAYEQGFVKEGVGAGGCAIAAYLYGEWTRSQLRHAVEAQLRLDG